MNSEEFLALHKLCMQIGSRLLDLERRVQRLEEELTKLQLAFAHYIAVTAETADSKLTKEEALRLAEIVDAVMNEIAEDVEEVDNNG